YTTLFRSAGYPAGLAHPYLDTVRLPAGAENGQRLDVERLLRPLTRAQIERHQPSSADHLVDDRRDRKVRGRLNMPGHRRPILDYAAAANNGHLAVDQRLDQMPLVENH